MKKTILPVLAAFLLSSIGPAAHAELTDEVATVSDAELQPSSSAQPAVASASDAMSLDELENATERTVKQDEVKPAKKEKQKQKLKKEKKNKKDKEIKSKKEKTPKSKKKTGSKGKKKRD